MGFSVFGFQFLVFSFLFSVFGFRFYHEPVGGASGMIQWNEPVNEPVRFSVLAFNFWFSVFGFQFSVFRFLMSEWDEPVGLSSGMSQ